MGATTTVVNKHQRCLKHTVTTVTTSLSAKGEDTSHSAITTTEPIGPNPTVTTSLSPKREPAEPSAVITTAELIGPTKREPTVLMSEGVSELVPPVKRSRYGKSHTIMTFSNEMEYNEFFRCGTSVNGNVSPCVNRNELTKFPMVFEEWQEHTVGSTCSKKWYRCRRQRGYRRSAVPLGHRPVRPKRQPKNKRQYIGCGCQARYRRTVVCTHPFVECVCTYSMYIWVVHIACTYGMYIFSNCHLRSCTACAYSVFTVTDL